MSACETSITFEQLIDGLLELFSGDKESVVIEEVQNFINKYKFDPNDFKRFTKWDKYKYTRNLVHEGNSKFNLILMCWPESVSSAVHDHADSHCFMRILAGNARETRYWWPKDLCAEDGSLLEMSRRKLESGQTAYMSDELGLHRVENESHTEKLCSLHLYSPPFADCNIFDQRTSKKTPIKMTFYSKFGEKEDHRPKATNNV